MKLTMFEKGARPQFRGIRKKSIEPENVVSRSHIQTYIYIFYIFIFLYIYISSDIFLWSSRIWTLQSFRELSVSGLGSKTLHLPMFPTVGSKWPARFRLGSPDCSKNLARLPRSRRMGAARSGRPSAAECLMGAARSRRMLCGCRSSLL